MIPLATYRFHLSGDDYVCCLSKKDSSTYYLHLCEVGVHKVWPTAGEIIQFKIYDRPRRPRRDEKRFHYHYDDTHIFDGGFPRIVFDEIDMDLEIHSNIADELAGLTMPRSDLWIELEDLTPKKP